MKKTLLLLVLIITNLCGYSQSFNYERVWATYFGDYSTRMTASEIDTEGNIYIVGAVNQQDYTDSRFYATAGVHQTNYGGGSTDGIVVKINPSGSLVWATYFGGENSEAISGITIDASNNIFIIGTTMSSQNIATPNAYQDNLNGSTDVFIAKFSNQGNCIWSTYYGGANEDGAGLLNGSSDIDEGNTYTGEYIVTDNQGNLYIANQTKSNNLATANVFQTTKTGDQSDLISKFTTGGQRVWATYYGINNSQLLGLCLNQNGLYVTGRNQDCPPNLPNTYFATTGCHQPQSNGCKNIFLSKFSFDGDRIWSTYYGNNAGVAQGRESLKSFGNSIYLTGSIAGPTGAIATPGTFQTTTTSSYTPFLAKFNDDGARQWGTFLGLNPDDANNFLLATIAIDSDGNPYLSGRTYMTENIATSGSYQETKAGLKDSYIVKFSPLGQRIWGTYYGGSSNEYSGKTLIYNDTFYLIGTTNSSNNISTSGSFQPNFLSNTFSSSPLNIYIAKFEPVPLATDTFNKATFQLYPNPNNGNFTITTQDNTERYALEIYDVLGQKVFQQNEMQRQTVNVPTLKNGMYLVKITSKNNTVQALKMIVKN